MKIERVGMDPNSQTLEFLIKNREGFEPMAESFGQKAVIASAASRIAEWANRWSGFVLTYNPDTRSISVGMPLRVFVPEFFPAGAVISALEEVFGGEVSAQCKNALEAGNRVLFNGNGDRND